MTCTNCERYKQSAAMWHHKAYELGGTSLPWKPEELLRKEYERGYADAMNWKTQNYLEHLPPKERPWVGLTDEEIDLIYMGAGKHDLLRARELEAKLKEKNECPDPSRT